MFKLKAAAPTSYLTCGSMISGLFQVATKRVRSPAAQACGTSGGQKGRPEAASRPNPAPLSKARRGHRLSVVSGYMNASPLATQGLLGLSTHITEAPSHACCHPPL